MNLRLLALAVLCALVGIPPAGKGHAQRDAPESLVTLDFLVTGPDGETPAALTPSDIVLKLDGRVRPIRSLELISPPDAAAKTVTLEGDPPAGTSRYIVLIVDEPTLYALEPIVKEAVAKALAAVSPRDLVAFMSTRGGGRQTALTTRHSAVTEAVDSMITGPGTLWSCQREMMHLVGALAPELPPGRSTSIVVISRGHPSGASYAGDTETGPCAPRRGDLRALEEALSVAQVNLHLLTVSESHRSWGFDTIAGNTGGTTALLTWSNSGAIARAIQSTARYYRATFVWGAAASRTQRVELRANLPGYKVRTSPLIRFRPPAGGGIAPAAPSADPHGT